MAEDTDNRPQVSLHKAHDKESIEEMLIPGSRLGDQGRLGDLWTFHHPPSKMLYVISVQGDKHTPMFSYDLNQL